MFQELVNQYLKKLKILLQSDTFHCLLIFLIFLYIIVFTKIINYTSKYSGKENIISGRIINFETKEKYLSLIIKGREKIKVNYYYKNKEEKDFYSNLFLYGNRVHLKGSFQVPINNTIPNTFNYKKYLYNNKIYYIFIAKEVKVTNSKNILFSIKNSITKYIYSFKSYKILNLFIMGNKDVLTRETYNVYKINGIAHLLAISGMHITFFILILNFMLQNIKKTYKEIIIIAFLLMYIFLTNFSVSVLRSVLFYFLKNLCKVKKINVSNLKILSLTAVILLLINPFYLYSISFIYSFVITLGLILSKPNKSNKFRTLVRTSYLSFLFSLPITAMINYEINIISVINNIILVPFVTIILYPLSLITVIFKFLDPLLYFCSNIFELLNNIFEKYSLLINIPRLNVILIVIYYFLLLLYIKYHRKRELFFILCILIINKAIPRVDNKYIISYLDQRTSIMIQRLGTLFVIKHLISTAI